MCPPLQETTVSQSVIINQREKQEGTAETEEAAKCTESAEEMEKDRQKGRGGGSVTPVCGYFMKWDCL